MSSDESGLARMTIAFDPAAVPIAGWLEPEQRPRQRFESMMELIALLEAARDPPLQRDAHDIYHCEP